MESRSKVGGMLVLGLLAAGYPLAGPARASDPALRYAAGGGTLKQQLQFWKSKEKRDETMAATAQSRHNTRAYNRWEQAVGGDQAEVTKLQQEIELAKEQRTPRSSTQVTSALTGQKGGGTAGAELKSLRQLIKQEILKDQAELGKMRGRLQQDKTSDPKRVARDKKILADLRGKLQEDRALARKMGLTKADVDGASSNWQQFWASYDEAVAQPV